MCQISCNSCSKVSIDSKMQLRKLRFSLQVKYDSRKKVPLFWYLGNLSQSGHTCLDGTDTYSNNLKETKKGSIKSNTLWNLGWGGIAELTGFVQKGEESKAGLGISTERIHELSLRMSLVNCQLCRLRGPHFQNSLWRGQTI